MRLRKFYNQLKLIIISIFLILSIFLGFIDEMFDLPDGWEFTIIFIAILMITRMLFTLYDINSNIEEIMEKEGLGLEHYHSYKEFFKALEDEISQPHSFIKLTHIRKDPPSGLNSGKNYFLRMEEKIKDKPDCNVTRIISINNCAMLEWARDLLELTEKYNNNFEVKEFCWKLKFPMINMAIIDHNKVDSKVFLAITADLVEETPGIQIKDPKVVQYFNKYYDNMWHKSSDLSRDLLEKRQKQLKE